MGIARLRAIVNKLVPEPSDQLDSLLDDEGLCARVAG